MLTVGSLFSGIGGIDLGLERAGMTVKWQSEIEPYSCRVLKKHWPDVPNLGDIKKIDWEQVEVVDVIAGGYPCQPFSTAGKRGGTDDPRHLWPEMLRAISTIRPRIAFLENVRGHYSLGFDSVLADLTKIGYDAQWETISALSVGAPHLRQRLICLAYPNDTRGGAPRYETNTQKKANVKKRQGQPQSESGRLSEIMADTHSDHTPNGGKCQVLQGKNKRWGDDRGRGRGDTGQISMGSSGEITRDVADSTSKCSNGEPDYSRDSERPETATKPGNSGGSEDVADYDSQWDGVEWSQDDARQTDSGRHDNTSRETADVSRGWWATEPSVGRVADGIPARVDRLRGLGNAVVPQVAETVGRIIHQLLT